MEQYLSCKSEYFEWFWEDQSIYSMIRLHSMLKVYIMWIKYYWYDDIYKAISIDIKCYKFLT